MTDPKEAAIQRLADALEATMLPHDFQNRRYPNWNKLARIAIEQGVVPAVNGLTVHIKIDGEYAPGQYTAETEIDWDAVCKEGQP